MRISDVMYQGLTEYKIEKWNEKKGYWEIIDHYLSYYVAINYYKLFKNTKKGIFRLIKVLELDELD